MAVDQAMKNVFDTGALLTAKYKDKTNSMTIGWLTTGFVWNKPVMSIFVRKSRYTYGLLDKAGEFTISIPSPKDENMKKALEFCGTQSGRKIDKYKECNLILSPSRKIETPIIEGCELYYECNTIYQNEMKPSLISDEIKKSVYNDGDYHTIFYAEILTFYDKDATYFSV